MRASDRDFWVRWVAGYSLRLLADAAGLEASMTAEVARARVDAVYARASAAILDVFLRARFHAPHLLGAGAPPGGAFVPSAVVWAALRHGSPGADRGSTFGVPHADGGPSAPPVGFVHQGEAWAFDVDAARRVAAAAALLGAGDAPPRVVRVAEDARVAWCAALVSAPPGAAIPEGQAARVAFHDTMMAFRRAWRTNWTGGGGVASGSGLGKRAQRARAASEVLSAADGPSSPEARVHFWVTPSSMPPTPGSARTRSPRSPAAVGGGAMPDPSAWFSPPLGPAVAMRSVGGRTEVMFGMALASDTLWVFRSSTLLCGCPPEARLREEFDAAALAAGVATASRGGASWVPSLLRVRLEHAPLCIAASSVPELAAHAERLRGRAVALLLQPAAVPMFRYREAAAACAHRIASAHAAAVAGEALSAAVGASRVRLALDCCEDGAPALAAVVGALGAALTGEGERFEVRLGGAPQPVVVERSGSSWAAAHSTVLEDLAAEEAAPSLAGAGAVWALISDVVARSAPDGAGFWRAVMRAPSAAAREGVAAAVAAAASPSALASRPPRDARAVWDATLGPGSWRRFCAAPECAFHDGPVALSRSLESTLGRALVTPLMHCALGAWGAGAPLARVHVALRGPVFALALSWDAHGSTRFEWMGAATAPAAAPARRAWAVRVSCEGALLWQCDDAARPGAGAGLVAALGRTGVSAADALAVDVAWSKRPDGRSVEIRVSDDGASNELRIRLGAL